MVAQFLGASAARPPEKVCRRDHGVHELRGFVRGYFLAVNTCPDELGLDYWENHD